MGKSIAGPLLVSFVVFFGTIGWLEYVNSEPSTKQLDADLANVRSEIEATEAESAKYSGGLVKAMIELRLQILQTTTAMLQQKRSSIIRKIDLKYNVDGETVQPDIERLKEIETDIIDAKSKLSDAESKAARYAGGLVQALALSNVAVRRLTVSQLQLAFYGEKYGISLPINLNLDKSKRKDGGSPGNVVEDNDAL